MGRHADPAAARRTATLPLLIVAGVVVLLVAGGLVWWFAGSDEGCETRETVALTVAPELGELTEGVLAGEEIAELLHGAEALLLVRLHVDRRRAHVLVVEQPLHVGERVPVGERVVGDGVPQLVRGELADDGRCEAGAARREEQPLPRLAPCRDHPHS